MPAWALNALPTIHAEDLNGQAYTLPQDLPSEKTLLLIAFKREQQKDVDTWIDGLNLKESSIPWLELPVLEDYGSWFKWFVDNGMRKGIKSEFDRSKVVTVYTDKSAFNTALGIETEETIYAAIIDQKGQILHREAGRFDPSKADKLLQKLTPTTGS